MNYTSYQPGQVPVRIMKKLKHTELNYSHSLLFPFHRLVQAETVAQNYIKS